MTYYVPNRMKEINSWGYWKLSKTKDDKLTKIPINAKTLNFAKTNDISDWADYNYCVNKFKNERPQVNGLSFRFTK